MVNSKSNKNYGVISQPETTDVIGELAIKYGLENENTEKELLEKMAQIENFEKREKIFENSPGRQIARTIKEVAQGKIKDKDIFIVTLRERLNISKETAQKLAKDLEEKVLNSVQKTFKEKEEFPSSQKIEEVIPLEKPTPPKKKDVYREPIE